jgi:hypothetical protein
MQATLTIDTHTNRPTTLPAADFDTICNALGLGGMRAIGQLRLSTQGVWDLTVGQASYRMTAV